MMTYQQAQEKMKGARNPAAGRPIANNTRLMQRGRDYAIRLHETDVPAFTTKQLFLELAPDYSPSNDPWGHAMGAFFAVADDLYQRTSGGSVEPGVPAEWGFRRGAAGYQDTDTYEYERLQELKPSTAELYRLGCFLHRLTGRLDRAGSSY